MNADRKPPLYVSDDFCESRGRGVCVANALQQRQCPLGADKAV